MLIFDEADSGLDVTTILVLRHLVQALARRGKSILYSSHVPEIVEMSGSSCPIAAASWPTTRSSTCGGSDRAIPWRRCSGSSCIAKTLNARPATSPVFAAVERFALAGAGGTVAFTTALVAGWVALWAINRRRAATPSLLTAAAPGAPARLNLSE